MQVLFKVKEMGKVKAALEADAREYGPLSRQSIIQKDAKALGLSESGTYIMMSGDDSAIALAKEKFGAAVEEVTGAKKDEIVAKINKLEEEAMEGFGGVFG